MASWPGVVRLVLNFSRSYGDQMINILHVERDPNSGNPNATEIDAILVATRDNLWDKAASAVDLRTQLDDDVTLVNITGTSVDDDNFGFQRVLSVGQAGAGLSTDVEFLPQAAVLISHKTAVASRRARGRTFLGGFDSAIITTSSSAYPVVSATAITQIETAFTNWRTALAALTVPYAHVIASTIPGEGTHFVTQSVCRRELYTQRRRGPRGGVF